MKTKGAGKPAPFFLAVCSRTLAIAVFPAGVVNMKSNARIPLIFGGLVAVAVVVGTLYMRNDAGPAALDAAQGPATGADGQPPPALATSVPPPGRAGGGAVRGADQSVEGQLVSHLEKRAEAREEHAARTRELKERSVARFASEKVDPAWAPAKETELSGLATNAAFEQAGAKPRSLSVDCRSSMCRLDGQFDSRSQAEDWVMMYMSSVGGAMPNSIVSRTQAADGSTRVEIYGRGR